MKVSDFDFPFDESLIASAPAEPRDSARLLVADSKADGFADRTFTDILDYLQEGDVLVANDAKVIPARLFGRKGDAKFEMLLMKPSADNPLVWSVLARNSRRLKPGDNVQFADGFSASIIEKLDDGTTSIAFETDNLFDDLRKHGHTPLPPYIDRPDNVDDKEDYQTVYAANDGAVAAPTAGLHFTQQLLEEIARRGIPIAYLTLLVGGGTFLPVKADDTDDHVMHSEFGVISPQTADIINRARRVVCIGTTSLRLLESAADDAGIVHPFSGETGIFITPGYRFKRTDALITNFHLPKSTLLMLVSAFMGREKMLAAYAHAVKERYRFFSYGDASLLIR